MRPVSGVARWGVQRLLLGTGLVTPLPVTEGPMTGMGEAGAIAAPEAVLNAVIEALAPFGAEIIHSPSGRTCSRSFAASP